MTKKQLTKRCNGIVTLMKHTFDGVVMEKVNNWMGRPVGVFEYAAISEHCMERQLQETSGRERLTTFMSDLSMAEWYGIKGVLDTFENAVTSWCDDEKFMAEFVLCVNWKSWEHHARKNTEWMKFYSILYENVRDLVYDYYKGNKEKTSYVWSYLD